MRYKPESWTARLDLETVFGRVPRRLEVDLGCGKGALLLARAVARPDVSFLGLDRQLLRIEKVERKTAKLGMANIRLIYVEADYAVKYMIPPGSVSTYYVFFPDPWPKKKHHSRRLFNESFLDGLTKTLAARGAVHVATDHQKYFGEIRALFENNGKYKEIEPFVPAETELTEFELLFSGLGREIGRCSFEAV